MKTISQFVQRRPWWACAFSAVLGFVLAIDFVAWRTTKAWPDWPVYLVLAGVLLILMWMDKWLDNPTAGDTLRK